MADKYFGSHEIQARNEATKSSSDRAFGCVFAAFFALIAVLSLASGGSHWPWWLALAVLFALIVLVRPAMLAPLNRLWTRVGIFLGAIISPIVLAIVFFLFISPIGWLMRLTGKDPLRLRFEPDADSYWIRREPPGPAPDSLNNQF